MTRGKPRRKEERSLLSPGGLIPLKPWGACLASWGWRSRWQSGQPGSKVGTRRDCSHSKWEFAKDTKPWGRGERREETVNLLLVKPLVGSFLLKKKHFFLKITIYNCIAMKNVLIFNVKTVFSFWFEKKLNFCVPLKVLWGLGIVPTVPEKSS